MAIVPMSFVEIFREQCHQLSVLLNIPEGPLGFSIHPRRVFSIAFRIDKPNVCDCSTSTGTGLTDSQSTMFVAVHSRRSDSS